ncbi:MAG TPA: ACP S-malonyltransferase [Spirochaetia bacterium]|nr:ACP S-malonyltransferase [Spirochaetia bacterium]
MKVCFLYPGQGAQYAGMGRDLYEASDSVRTLVEAASDATSMDLKKLLFEGTDEELAATDKTQVSITVVNLAARLVLSERGIESEGAAGFSLGEYSALHDAAVLALADVMRVVRIRGDAMEKASRALDTPSGKPGMIAVIGLEIDRAREVLAKLDGRAYLANRSSPNQIVVAGTQAGLAAAERDFTDAGAMRIIPLKVSGPFHTPLIASASEELADALREVTFSDPQKPVYANVTGARIASGAEARELCIRQVFSPVQWVDEEQAILDDGFDSVVEVGPGTVLSGLWKSFHRGFRSKPAGKLSDIESITTG